MVDGSSILLSDSLILDGLRLLVVDDNSDSREIITLILEEYGAEVTAVDSASAALETLERVQPDILISDIAMPELDGYSLISQLRSLEEAQAGRQTPAIALTAYGEEERAQVLSAGFQMHLTKPVESAELVAVVATLAGRERPVTRR